MTATPQPITMAPMDPTQVHLANERAYFARKLAIDDAARTAAATVDLVAIAAFTLVDDDAPDGRVINAGEEFSVSAFDLPRYVGRARLKSLDAAAPALKAGTAERIG